MSWSVGGIGKPDVLGKRLEDDYSKLSKMYEPEESIKECIREAVRHSCSVKMAPNIALKVESGGSQWMANDNTIALSSYLRIEQVILVE